MTDRIMSFIYYNCYYKATLFLFCFNESISYYKSLEYYDLSTYSNSYNRSLKSFYLTYLLKNCNSTFIYLLYVTTWRYNI